MRGHQLRSTGSNLIALVTAAAVLGSSFARAAEPVQKLVRLGFVHSQSPSTTNRGLSAFWERLAELGWVQGRNLVSAERWAEGRRESDALKHAASPTTPASRQPPACGKSA